MSLRQTIKNILLKIGKRLQIDTIFYTKILGWVGVNYTTNVLRGVATTFLLARLLPTETFGAFRYVIAIYGLASTFSFSSYNSSIIRGIAENDTETAWAGGKKMIHYSLIGSLVIIAAGIERAWKGEPVIAACLFVAALFFPFASASGLYGAILTGKNQIDTLSKHHSLNNIAFISSFLFTLFVSKGNLIATTLVFFGADVGIRGLLTLYHLSKLERRGSATKHLSLGSQLSAMGVVQAFAHQIDQLIIQRFFGYTSLANYNIAILIPEQIIDFIKGFTGILLQRKTANTSQKEKDLKTTQKQMGYFLGFTILIWIAYSFSAPFAIKLLFPQYSSQIIPTIIYATGILGTSTTVSLTWMQANHRIKELWKFSLANSSLQILTTLLFTPWLGGMGAIIAKTTTRLASIPFSIPKTKNQL